MFLASIAPSFSLYLLCNALYGVGVPIVSLNTLVMLWSYYPRRKGLISGLLLSSLVFGSSLSSLILPYLINPNNQAPDLLINHGVVTNHLYSEVIASRLPSTLRALGLFSLLPGLLAIPFYLPIQPAVLHKTSFDDNKCEHLSTALRTKVFWYMFGLGLLSTRKR